jgi:hypothetical protein
MEKKSKHATMRFPPQEREAIAHTRDLSGCLSATEATHLALRIVARGEGVPPTQAPNKARPFSPSRSSAGFYGPVR